jgi:DNA-binding MarR family transcriptional regulator
MPLEEREWLATGDLRPPRAPLQLSDEEREVDAAMAVWTRAARFRRRANYLLRRHGLSFGAWKALDAIDKLVRETGDVVSQLAVIERCESDKSTVSALVKSLTELGLLDWDMDAWGRCYRIFVTKKGTALLAMARSAVVEAGRDTEVVLRPGVVSAPARRAGERRV